MVPGYLRWPLKRSVCAVAAWVMVSVALGSGYVSAGPKECEQLASAFAKAHGAKAHGAASASTPMVAAERGQQEEQALNFFLHVPRTAGRMFQSCFIR